MTIHSEIESKSTELKSLIPAVESGDADAMAKASTLADELTDLKGRAEKAASFGALLDGMGNAQAKSDAEPETLGAAIAEAVKGAGYVRGSRISVGATCKAAATDVLTTTTLRTIDQRVIMPSQSLGVLDLFGSEQISGNALQYFVLSDFTGNPTTVAENAQKPQIGPAYTSVTETLTKVAAWWKESDEILEDAPWLASSVNNHGIYRLRKLIESQLISGNGTAPNLTGILNRSGIQSVTYTQAAGLSADNILKAAMNVESSTGFEADAIVINPTDYYNLRIAKDSNNQYYGGGYFSAPYGNGDVRIVPELWGIKTVVSSAITSGTVLVGAFRQGASIVRKAGSGLRVEVANQDSTDFEYNRITVRVEERLGLAVRYPAAFCAITQAS